MSPVRLALIAAHLALAVAVLAMLSRHLALRAQEANEVRSLAGRDRIETERLRDEIRRLEELRKGVERQDPFVIELLAREKLQWARPGEKSPPAVPTVDKSAPTSNQ